VVGNVNILKLAMKVYAFSISEGKNSWIL